MNSAAKSASGSFKIKIPAKITSASTFDQTKRRRKGQEEEAEVRVEEQFILRLQIPEEDREKFREQVRSRHYVDDIAILFKGMEDYALGVCNSIFDPVSFTSLFCLNF